MSPPSRTTGGAEGACRGGASTQPCSSAVAMTSARAARKRLGLLLRGGIGFRRVVERSGGGSGGGRSRIVPLFERLGRAVEHGVELAQLIGALVGDPVVVAPFGELVERIAH